MNLLFTSGGRRVSLVRSFREALGTSGRVIVGDADPTAPALYVADQGIILPKVSEPEYIEVLLQAVERYRVRAIIPLIDPELPLLAGAADRFARLGCCVLTPPPGAVAISHDKWLTAGLFAELSVPHPQTALLDPSAPVPPAGTTWPVVVKPRAGSAGKGVTLCESAEELIAASRQAGPAVVQEFLSGEEITVDLLGDLSGRVVRLVQRQRLKIRAGEVERGVTVRDPAVEELALRIGSALRPVGCINLQCFRTAGGPFFTEINARFGGGYPLAQAAGADFPRLLVQALAGEELQPVLGAYEVGLLMLRYDGEVILRRHELIGG